MTESQPKIEVYYFNDCPSWRNAVEILQSVLDDMGIVSHVSLQRIETQDEAVLYRFMGSPSIRINGEDLFPTGQEQFGLGCRVYQTPEGFRGWPTEAMLKEELVKHIRVD